MMEEGGGRKEGGREGGGEGKGRREDDGEVYLLLRSPCGGQKLLFNNQETFHRSVPPGRVLRATGGCCHTTGTIRGLGLSGSTTNQTPSSTIPGGANRGPQPNPHASWRRAGDCRFAAWAQLAGWEPTLIQE